MSKNSLKIAQLFFKYKLKERLSECSKYEDFQNQFCLNLINYDLYKEDIHSLISIIPLSKNLNHFSIRLSNTLSNPVLLSDLLKIIEQNKNLEKLEFYIKYLPKDLFKIFTCFLISFQENIQSLKIIIKYDTKNEEEKALNEILSSLIKNVNFSVKNLNLTECRLSSIENINLLNELFNKNSAVIENFSLSDRCLLNNNFSIDISQIKKVEITNCQLSFIHYFPVETLNLSFNNISNNGIGVISDLLSSKSCTLKKLNLKNNYLGDDGCIILSKGIKDNKSLISLNLSNNNIIYEGLIAIANSLKENNYLKKINFHKNLIDNVGFMDFYYILKNIEKDRFTKIDFSDNEISNRAMEDYGLFLRDHSKINFLSLSKKINEENKKKLLSQCKNLSNLKKIIFENFSISDDNCRILNKILENNKNIKHFQISDFSTITPSNISILSSGIKNNTKLKKLILSQCSIQDEGAITLSKALVDNTEILEVYLEDNKIGESGIKAISEKILTKNSLQVLVVSHNLINSKGAEYISENLINATGIRSLFMNSNQIGDEGCEYLAKGIKENNSLYELSLDYNNISDKGINLLSKVLVGKENFFHLYISDNKISKIGANFYELLKWIHKIKIGGNQLGKDAIEKLLEDKSNRLLKKIRFKILDENSNYLFKNFNTNLKDFDLSFNYKINLSLLKKIISFKNISQINLQSNNITDHIISILVNHIIEINAPLKILKLQSNKITSVGSKDISFLLKNNIHLKVLNLAGNPLGYIGIRNICIVLEKSNNVLEQLLINYTKCNNYCSKDIYNMLIKNNKIIILTLLGNFFNNNGIDIILSALRKNNKLLKLSVGDNKTDSRAFNNIGNYLKYNKSIRVLEIKSSRIQDDILYKLGKVLQDNKNLVKLNLMDNYLSYEGMIKFGLRLRKNYVVNEVQVLLNKPQKEEQDLIQSCNAHISFS